MIKEYGIYNHHEYNNTLLILFSDAQVTKVDDLGEVEVLYSEEKLAGYRIKNFIRYAKIKYSGLIFLPADPLIDVINVILRKYHLESLGYKKHSGYVTKYHEDKVMVYASSGTFLRDETISHGRFCTYYDLYINHENEHQLAVFDEKTKENEDFFKMEVR